MIEIVPRNPPPRCIASPDVLDLPGTVRIRFSARSSEPAGEDAVITFDVGAHSEVLIAHQGKLHTTIEVRRHIGPGSTPIDERLSLVAQPGKNPCGGLRIDISVRPEGSNQPDDQCISQLRIPCA